ncbi:hypothetical protein GQ602_003251 [Ophiocordyceps camponoti-floridani]|uniref:Uncharacterized protein n=1 Tax=Ophiocordyceps camponoti-floridani TaxID=2030778 RepID=A0A8H4Q7U9_9HYPO|nr:hypothetical protein GQ602_003251 [Ophiocordyceps camponoti-floridani]
MARLQGQPSDSLQDQSAAIFSPSVARVAASTARDWSYIDAWLASKFPAGRSIPPFERNQSTLEALLALALANETADDERSHLARASASTLRRLEQPESNYRLRDTLITCVQGGLTDEGSNALDAIANVAIRAASPLAAPHHFGRDFVRLQASLPEAELMISRLDLLRRHIDHEADLAVEAHRAWQDHGFKPFPDTARQNLELQRKAKLLRSQLADLRDRARRHVGSPQLTIEDASRLEHSILALMARFRELQASTTSFDHRLSNDTGTAQNEVDALRKQLRHTSLDGSSKRRDP